jgi:hypothetical protein
MTGRFLQTLNNVSGHIGRIENPGKVACIYALVSGRIGRIEVAPYRERVDRYVRDLGRIENPRKVACIYTLVSGHIGRIEE